MYLSFYGLHKKPFQVSADPSFLWLGEKHNEALATLKYGNLGNQGFILLTGDVGTGKTTLINALINSVGDDVIAAKVPDPGMETIDFMNYIAHAFGMNKRFTSKDAFLIDFEQFLNSAHDAGKKSLLIIDEAQRLSSALLEEIRQLSNIERQYTKLLSIFLVGQNEFNDVLAEHKNRALRQRITLNYVIEPLSLRETGEFIRHRLKVAGTEKDIFSPDAIHKIHKLSGGFPRKINIICDHSLLFGFAESANTITGEMVEECVKDLLLPEVFQDNESPQPTDTDTAAAESSPEVAPQPLREVTLPEVTGKSWKTFSAVILIVLALVIIAVIMYRGKYGEFLSHVNTHDIQSYEIEPAVNTVSANNATQPNLVKAAQTEEVSPDPEIQLADPEAESAALTGEAPQLEEEDPVSAVPVEEPADIAEQAPFAPALPDNKKETIEDKKSPLVTNSLPDPPEDSPSDLQQNTAEDEEEIQVTPDTSTPVTVENKEPENLDSGALIDWVIKKRAQ